MNTKLITALRLTAGALEAGTFAYNWRNLYTCNCGALFCALSGRSAAQLKAAVKPFGIHQGHTGTWTELVGTWCPITGMTTQALFVELLGYGLTTLDITQLEYLKNPAVLARVGRPLDHTKAADAAAYMRAWAGLLVEQAQGEAPGLPEQELEPAPAIPHPPHKPSLWASLLAALGGQP